MTSLWLRVVSLIVPRDRRGEWLAEWRGEIAHDGTGGGSRRATHQRAGLAAGSLSHAFWMRRLEWSFTASDLRYALRLVARQPGFAAVVIGTLAIGIGAATAMFTVVHGVLLKPLPYPEPDRLVWMYGAFRQNDSASVSPMDFLDYRERNEAFAAVGGTMIGASYVTVATAEGPLRFRAFTITSGVISALGVAPAMGRDFTRDEERLAGPQSVVLSHYFWRERFHARPDVIGQAVTVDGQPRTIVGVMPAGFRLPHAASVSASEDVAFYMPFPFDADEARVRGYHFLRLIGRLKPGVELASAQSHMDVIARDLESKYPENDTWRLRLVPLHEEVVGDVRRTLSVMMAAVVLVLVVACANVAGLLMARGSSRQPEIAVRRALGASRARIVRQLLMEGVLLACAGSGAGLLLAWGAVRALRQLNPINLPRMQDIALDPLVVAFAIVAGVGTTLLFAIVPALQAAGRDGTLRHGARTAGSRGASRGRAMLVAGQVALSTMLLIGAGLLARSFMRVTSVDPGFSVDKVHIAQVSLPAQRYESMTRVQQFYDDLLERVAALPGIDAAALATSPPLTGGNDISVRQAGQPKPVGRDRHFAQVRSVQGRYFDAAGVRLEMGRAIDDARDKPGAPAAAVISRAMANEIFPGENPIGRRVLADFDTPIVAEVVGVAADARVFGQTVDAPPMMYFSARQSPSNFLSLVVRTATPESDIAPMLRATVRDLDPELAIGRVRGMKGLLAESVEEPRFRAGLILSFAAVALALTLVGLYGTLAYSVTQRTREIGIRFALGARSGSVLGLVLRQGALLVAIGASAGIAGALAASRLLEEMLFQTRPREPMVFIGVPLVIGLVALAAMLAPARRASRVDPIRALRAD